MVIILEEELALLSIFVICRKDAVNNSDNKFKAPPSVVAKPMRGSPHQRTAGFQLPGRG